MYNYASDLPEGVTEIVPILNVGADQGGPAYAFGSADYRRGRIRCRFESCPNPTHVGAANFSQLNIIKYYGQGEGTKYINLSVPALYVLGFMRALNEVVTPNLEMLRKCTQ